MKVKYAVCVTGLLFVYVGFSQQLPRLEIDPLIDQTKYNFRLWAETIIPVHDEVAESPKPIDVLKIIPSYVGTPIGGCGTIGLPLHQGWQPLDKNNLNDLTYIAMTHEYGHAKQCKVVESQYREGHAELGMILTYNRLAEKGIAKPASRLFISDILNNLPKDASGGDKGFAAEPSNLNHKTITAASNFEYALQILGDADLKRFDRKFRADHPLDVSVPDDPELISAQQILATLDSLADPSSKLLPSTRFLTSPVTYEKGPDGYFLGAYAFDYVPGWNFTPAPVNSKRLRIFYFERVNGYRQARPGVLQYTITSSSGVEMTKGTVEINAINSERPIETDTAKWSKGAYKLEVCTVGRALCTENYFLVYPQPWTHGKKFFIANGPKFGDLSENLKLQVQGNAEFYPGLVVLNSSSQPGEVTVSDGRNTRVFPEVLELSTIDLWTQRAQPHVHNNVNPATFFTSGVVPGSLTTVLSFRACDQRPETFISPPWPISFCGGESVVEFIGPNQIAVKAPVYYAAPNQLNIQVPPDLKPGTMANIRLTHKGISSNLLAVPVIEADPSIFIMHRGRFLGCGLEIETCKYEDVGSVIFALGENVGRLATPALPVTPGDILAVFATGLGAVDSVWPEEGHAVSDTSARVIAPVSVTLGSQPCEVHYAGLAPGFVGLYQVNLVVPKLSPGVHPLEMTVGNIKANTVYLTVK